MEHKIGIIAKMVKQAREGAGMNRSELARRLGVPYQRVYEWETGRKQPRRLDEIIALCEDNHDHRHGP